MIPSLRTPQQNSSKIKRIKNHNKKIKDLKEKWKNGKTRNNLQVWIALDADTIQDFVKQIDAKKKEQLTVNLSLV